MPKLGRELLDIEDDVLLNATGNGTSYGRMVKVLLYLSLQTIIPT